MSRQSKFKHFLNKHKGKILIIVTLLILVLIPKIKALFGLNTTVKKEEKSIEPPLDDDYEVLPDLQAQSNLIAKQIGKLLHSYTDEEIKNHELNGTTVKNWSEIDPNVHFRIHELLRTNISIFKEIQKEYHRMYKHPFLKRLGFKYKDKNLEMWKTTFKGVEFLYVSDPPNQYNKFHAINPYPADKPKQVDLFLEHWYNWTKRVWFPYYFL